MKTDLHRTDELILARLRNCELPDDLETQEITLEIEDLEKRLHPDDSATDTAVASESHRERDLEQHLAFCRALIAPLRRLPSELLLEIYRIIIASVRRRSPSPKEQLHPTRALMVLSHVCSFWRSVILSTTTFWNDIRIPSLFRNGGDARLVEMHLQYSASSPLDIEIHYFGGNRNPHMVNARDILNGLILHCERWRRVLVIGVMTWEALSSEFLRTSQTQSLRFPLLEALYIQDSNHSGFNPFSTADLPRLQTMELHGYNPSSFPFRQLTSLTLVLDRRETTAYQLPRDLAKHFPNLEHLRLVGEFDFLPEAGGPDLEPVLPKLKSLVLELYSRPMPFLSIFLTTISLPALHSVEIVAPLQDWPQAEFTSLLARSQRLLSLKKLSLIWSQIKDEQLLEILRSTRNLEELKIIEDRLNTLSPSLLRAMSIGLINNPMVIVPKLQHITFLISISEKKCPVGLEMVASRSEKALSSNFDSSTSCLPLKSFKLSLILKYTPSEIPTSLAEDKLQVLRESMDVIVTVSHQNTPFERQNL